MEILVRKPGTGRPTHDEGDIFAIFEDGRCEIPSANGIYWLMRFPGEHSELWGMLLQPRHEDIPVTEHQIIDEVIEKPREMVYRRSLRLIFSKIPAIAMQELNIKCYCVMPLMDYASLFEGKP